MVLVTIDGKLVGTVISFPVITLGRINLLFWKPVVSSRAFDLRAGGDGDDRVQVVMATEVFLFHHQRRWWLLPEVAEVTGGGGCRWWLQRFSASDANFGENPEMTISLDDVDEEQFEVQVEEVPPTRPIGRDKAKAEAKAKGKGKAGIESSEINLRKLKLMDEISSTNRAKFEEIDMFKYKINKFY
ncbi:hypothetical protein R6Q59_011274 [Mikania micrantha]